MDIGNVVEIITLAYWRAELILKILIKKNIFSRLFEWNIKLIFRLGNIKPDTPYVPKKKVLNKNINKDKRMK